MLTQTQADAFIAQYIAAHPVKPGADEVWLKDYRISVWAIVGQWKGQSRNVQRTADAYGIPIEAVEAALAYYERNQAVIDNRRSQNSPDWDNDELSP